MKEVLFVCTANTCRSPMVPAIFDTLAEDESLPFRAESAGTEAPEGTAMAENAEAEAPCLGCTSMRNAWWGRFGDYQEPGASVVE